MTKINIGLILLIMVIIMLILFYLSTNKSLSFITEEIEAINSKLDHLEYELHELEEK